MRKARRTRGTDFLQRGWSTGAWPRRWAEVRRWRDDGEELPALPKVRLPIEVADDHPRRWRPSLGQPRGRSPCDDELHLRRNYAALSDFSSLNGGGEYAVRNWRTRGQEWGRKERRPTLNTGARAPERTAGIARTRRRSVMPARGLRGDGDRARDPHVNVRREGGRRACD
jgi:hypothetical protein